jgi:hypothetical protein
MEETAAATALAVVSEEHAEVRKAPVCAGLFGPLNR